VRCGALHKRESSLQNPAPACLQCLEQYEYRERTNPDVLVCDHDTAAAAAVAAACASPHLTLFDAAPPAATAAALAALRPASAALLLQPSEALVATLLRRSGVALPDTPANAPPCFAFLDGTRDVDTARTLTPSCSRLPITPCIVSRLRLQAHVALEQRRLHAATPIHIIHYYRT
jgi:hypothetical protein